ncbi:MAG: hypothetical protein C0505_12805 [Leptothrix sp. (in: Bacteria)]|nr:hypothetical protein [Leptothrix sp. (in: b-proteobacteria)]
MKPVPFPVRSLRLAEPLPFDLCNAAGQVLLKAGRAVDYPTQLDALARSPLFADDAEMSVWTRRLLAPTDLAPAPPALSQQWQELVEQLEESLLSVRAGGDWRARLFTVHGRARALFERRPDASLYHHVYQAGHTARQYSCHHALLSLVIAEYAAARLGWSQELVDSLGRAALTMNVAMLELQDELAATRQKPTPAMRAEIDAHAKAGATLLEAAGFGDRLCLSVVRQHHIVQDDGLPLADQPPDRQLALLLRRVDIFTAKISRRATRTPMSPVRAAREACLGADGQPDALGGAMLKAVGLYPPGCFVSLANGEVGIVVARGERANVPRVAALLSPRGSPLGEPLLRDTSQERFAVRTAVAPSSLKVRLPHERLQALG